MIAVNATFINFPGSPLSHQRFSNPPEPGNHFPMYLHDYSICDNKNVTYKDDFDRRIVRFNWIYLVESDFNTCFFPNCLQRAKHTHHVDYQNTRVLPYGTQVRLCPQHHRDITVLNGMAAKDKGYKKLTHEERNEVFYDWLAGFIQPIYTPETTAWINRWKEEYV